MLQEDFAAGRGLSGLQCMTFTHLAWDIAIGFEGHRQSPPQAPPQTPRDCNLTDAR